MGRYGQLLGELGRELGFTIENDRLTLHLGGGRDAMRGDLQNIGNDMRKVIQRGEYE